MVATLDNQGTEFGLQACSRLFNNLDECSLESCSLRRRFRLRHPASLAGAALHLIAAYPRVSAGLAASNLNAGLQAAMRAVFLMVGWDWIVIGIVALIAAFTETRIRKAIVLFCGLALLVQTPIWVGLMGWFIGNEMLLAAGALIVCGGLLFRPPSANTATVSR